MRISRILMASVVTFVAALPLFSQDVSFGALDLIGSSASREDEASYSFDALVSAVKGNAGEVKFASDVLDAVAGGADPVSYAALAYVASSGRNESALRVLNYVSGRGAANEMYYASGVWAAGRKSGGANQFGIPGNGWGGMMYAAPQWGRITSRFGFRPSFGRMHKGIDIAMSVGDTVRVPLGGTVDRISYESGGYGNYIVIKHPDGLETRYAHLSAVIVSPGEAVSPNQPIALSGNTGNSTGPHLHFETRIQGSAIDPETVFDFAGGVMMAKVDNNFSPNFKRSTPGGALERVTAAGSAGASLSGKRTYVVKAGDTLEKIAVRAGVSVMQLRRMNFISEGDQPKPGTMIRISK